MGCDIHAHAEVKIKGKWHHYGVPDFGRNYQLFGKMAGVRDTTQHPLAPRRGFPKDASTVTKLEHKHWEGDSHSDSWLSAGEIAALRVWWDVTYAGENGMPDRTWDHWLCGQYFSGFTTERESYPEDIEDVRFVFWFDN